MNCIQYAAGYKYVLRRLYSTITPIIPPKAITTPWIWLSENGLLTIMMDYAWDGPSGPTLDTPDSIRPSLVHDAFYQLIREGYLDRMVYRDAVDRLFREMLLQDGMFPLRAEYWFAAVRAFGDPACDPAVAFPDKMAGFECAPGWNPQLPEHLAP